MCESIYSTNNLFNSYSKDKLYWKNFWYFWSVDGKENKDQDDERDYSRVAAFSSARGETKDITYKVISQGTQKVISPTNSYFLKNNKNQWDNLLDSWE